MFIDLKLGNLSLGICEPATFPVRGRVAVAKIATVVEAFYGLDPGDIMLRIRHRRIVYPRQVAMYLARKMTHQSLPAIGHRLGGFDHSTVIHAIKAVKQRIADDPDFAVDVEVLRERLSA